MRHYKDRYLRKISHGISVAYLVVAMLWGISTYTLQKNRNELKKDFNEGEISKEEFLQQSMEFSKDEEKVFKSLFLSFCSINVSDIAFAFLTKDKEF